MCGIFAYLGNHINIKEIEREFQKTRMRGPDDSQLKLIREEWLFGFHRLKIVDTSDRGNQPMRREECYSICNGEIYNHLTLRKNIIDRLTLSTNNYGNSLTLENDLFLSKSDCEIIPIGYRFWGIDSLVDRLDGVFSFVLYDEEKDQIFLARDRLGVRPMFWGWNSHGELLVASEAKSISTLVDKVEPFPPGHYWSGVVNSEGFLTGQLVQYYLPMYPVVDDVTSELYVLDKIQRGLRDKLVQAVQKRLMSDRPVGCLLSGGLDSSLVSALVAREFKKTGRGDLLTFSVGLPGSPDLDYADRVSSWIGSKHHRVELGRDVWLKAIPEVIYAIESYDVTTVRASVGNYLIAKYIKENTDIVVVYNGDGSDEQSGYLYLGNAPDIPQFQSELCRLLREIHQFDVLRSDRAISSKWGLEARTPFLDRDFVDYYMGVVPTAWKSYGRLGQKILGGDSKKGVNQIEKSLLRGCFEGMDLLPPEVLWRRKEAFSDGCSSVNESWHDIIKAHVDKIISPEEFQESVGCYSPRPLSREALYYRRIYDSHFGPNRLVDHYWMPRWSEGVSDPSARELADYSEKKNVGVSQSR